MKRGLLAFAAGSLLWAGAAFADRCMQNCEQISEPCIKACQKPAKGNSGLCKSKCDEGVKKCKDRCAKKQ